MTRQIFRATWSSHAYRLTALITITEGVLHALHVFSCAACNCLVTRWIAAFQIILQMVFCVMESWFVPAPHIYHETQQVWPLYNAMIS
ncbi:hypothetical protein BJ166DRAFT_236593 [Pestalotiopsis sp. NC0098]|nr:hypothetical protein BJ166DRAFT_236593 [Pestalotiopsis sp. NC0098]